MRFCPLCEELGVKSPMIVIDVGNEDQITGQEWLCEKCLNQEEIEKDFDSEELPYELARI